MQKFNCRTFQGLILALQDYWSRQGCTIMQPCDIEVGAGTSHPVTCLRAITQDPFAVTYVQPSRRPVDGRYGKNPNRLQCYYQFQVVIKPSPKDFQKMYLNSLQEISLSPKTHDIRFVEDNWENPTLGAWGLGWEVWLNGMEITQLTYFQQVGGLNCRPITGEITYGLERLSMYLQGVDNVYDLIWNKDNLGVITYRDFFYQNELEQSAYNFKYSSIDFLFTSFDHHVKEAQNLLALDKPLALPAYEQLLKAIHNFNLLDARKAISVTERQRYILKIRALTKEVVQAYYISYKTTYSRSSSQVKS